MVELSWSRVCSCKHAPCTYKHFKLMTHQLDTNKIGGRYHWVCIAASPLWSFNFKLAMSNICK